MDNEETELRIRSDYKICKYCGAALDVGEFCDCLQGKKIVLFDGPKKHVEKNRCKQVEKLHQEF